jgi:hypothetical protein
MADDYEDDYLEETCETGTRHCEDCRVLTEALWDMEQQRREAEDERFQNAPLALSGDIDVLDRQEDTY